MRFEFTTFEFDYSIKKWIRLNHYINWTKKTIIIEFDSITPNTTYKAQPTTTIKDHPLTYRRKNAKFQKFVIIFRFYDDKSLYSAIFAFFYENRIYKIFILFEFSIRTSTINKKYVQSYVAVSIARNPNLT
jgi:hypothetical protein